MKDQDFEQKLLDMKLQYRDLVSNEEQETAWKDILLEIDAKKRKEPLKWMMIAAGVTLVITIGWWLLPDKQKTFVTNQSEQLEIQLSDRSKVTLNSNSKLTIPENFNQEIRSVKLEGQAFFNIQKISKKPFIIIMGDRQVQVLGTSFDIKHQGNTTIISVRSGKVQLSSLFGVMILESQQKARIDASGRITIEEWEFNEWAWYSGTLNFENKSMREVAQTLTELSDKPVVISDKISDCRLSIKIDYERIEEVFDVIAETLELKWNEESKRIYFDGKGC